MNLPDPYPMWWNPGTHKNCSLLVFNHLWDVPMFIHLLSFSYLSMYKCIWCFLHRSLLTPRASKWYASKLRFSKLMWALCHCLVGWTKQKTVIFWNRTSSLWKGSSPRASLWSGQQSIRLSVCHANSDLGSTVTDYVAGPVDLALGM